MLNSLYLAWRYILFHKIKTLILVVSITLIIYLPIGLNILMSQSEQQLMERANNTPLVIGSKGSSLDLVINSLYFETAEFDKITMKEVERVDDIGFALPIPMHIKYKARKYPIVGTTLDYFDFRGIEIEKGSNLAVLGDCVLGANVARDLGLGVGGGIVSSPENVLDIAGIYPLKMKVVGVLRQSKTADDDAIFTDLKTAWVIEGLGHGHEDLSKTSDPSVLLKADGNKFVANAKLFQYNEITVENIDGFHFHGDTSIYPITSIIAVPNSDKAEALLMGRYISKGEKNQIVKPDKVVSNLLEGIFKIKKFLDSIFVVVLFATLLLLSLIIMLSLRLREKEILTMFKLGSSRFKIAELIVLEFIIIFIISAGISEIMVIFTKEYVDEFIKLFVI